MSMIRKAFVSFCGIFITGAATAAPDFKTVQIEPPPLDGKRAPTNGLVPWLAKNGLYGYADHKGVVKIPPQFEEARLFYEGFAAVRPAEDKWKLGFIQPSGAYQIAPIYDDVGDFLDGEAKAFLYSKGVSDPLWGKEFISGTLREYNIDRRGAELKKWTRAGVLAPMGLFERMLHRYPEPDQEEGWDSVRRDGKWYVKSRDGKERDYGEVPKIIHDVSSGAVTFFAGRQKDETWTVWNRNGSQVGSGFANVGETSSEGCFVASRKPLYRYAAYDSKGHRVTAELLRMPFVFHDGLAEAEFEVNRRTGKASPVFVDRTGRLYADPELIREMEEQRL
jgi:hypothetical protein